MPRHTTVLCLLLVVICTVVSCRSVPITFSGGKSGIYVNRDEEFTIFEYTIPQNKKLESAEHAAITHFWLTGGNHSYVDFAVVRYYIDGESVASIQFQPALAAGVGYGDDLGPWGNELIGHAIGEPSANLSQPYPSSWYLKIRVPFQKAISVTLSLPLNATGEGNNQFFCQVRGAVGIKINVGGVYIPSGAQMLLQTKYSQLLQPLDYYDLLSLSTGQGLVLMSTLQVQSTSINFEEGCFRLYTPANITFNQSMLLSTGGEDYYDSAYGFFDAYPTHFPSAGFTHSDYRDGTFLFSAYRMHTEDIVTFSNGVRLVWRNGDTAVPSPTGLNKCVVETGGVVQGQPAASVVTSYAWAYVWQDEIPA